VFESTILMSAMSTPAPSRASRARPPFAAWVLGLLAATALAATAFAQGGPQLSISQLDTSGLPDLSAVGVVTTAEGRPAQGLDASAFSATVGGRPIEVLDVSPQVDKERGLAVVIAIDTSGSMVGEPIVQGKQAAHAFVDSLLEDDRAALLSFAGAVVEGEFTTDFLELGRAIDALVADGETVLYDAVVASLAKANEAETPARAVVLLSDGADHTSRSATRESSIQEGARMRLPVFTMGIGQGVDEAYLQELSRASGGRYFLAPSAQEIPGVFAQINELLRSRYLVHMRLPEGVPAAGDLELTVTVDGVPAATRATLPVAGSARPGGDGGSGARIALVAAAIVVAALVLAGGAYWYWQRREEPSPVPLDQNDPAIATVQPRAAGVPAAVPNARLLVLEGPQEGAAVDVRDQPVTLGTHPACTLRLKDANGEVAPRHARVWLRQGRFMIHHVAPVGVTRVGGRETDWAVLESGDDISIGPHRILFEVGER